MLKKNCKASFVIQRFKNCNLKEKKTRNNLHQVAHSQIIEKPNSLRVLFRRIYDIS